ncbi:MAG TPA: tRNA (adenosine(37)-N6)-threonylcarbamoyltransferase complex ATPase subunit type 1 TsaE [Afifellaceae bacterium]|nr:tRNA (adenosine(37)-N6)-threonylcarbamoyltransferase complex ATPase subunit type 1 TsaE [Afifellaceae bacterium]
MSASAAPPAAVPVDISEEAATWRLAEDVAAVLQPGDLVALAGDLGAGKTSFARAMIRAACGDPALDVPSPTFAIRIDYQAAHLQIAHADLYRIAGGDEADELGLDEALETGALIVEWPDRIDWPPVANRLDIDFEMSGARRTAALKASGAWPERLKRTRRIRDLIEAAGFGDAQRLHVVGDVSAKAFERIVRGDGSTAILMNAPAREPGPAVWHGRSYDAVAHRALDVTPFLAIGATLADAGVHVPAVIAHDRAEGLVLMEDLGDEGIADESGEPIAERYEAAVDLLAYMHGRDWPDEPAFDGKTCRVPPYDAEALLIEISLFADWHVPHVRGGAWSNAERTDFLDAWRTVLGRIGTTPATWVMRDFHSPNILWQAGETGMARVGVIDIQDTLVGHPAYDVASLAQDARVEIGEKFETALVDRYLAARRGADAGFDDADFDEAYAILGAQRATKVLGAFTRLAFHDGRTAYGAHIPRVKNVLARNLKHPVLSGLRVWYADLL